MKRRQQAGFNLIEVLVAMVILAVGLLGVARLQLTGIRANQGSLMRSQATTFMNDMAERMYANLPGVRDTTQPYGGVDLQGQACTTPPRICSTQSGVAAQSCTPVQMAAWDIYQATCGSRSSTGTWMGGINNSLPAGRLQIRCVGNALPISPVACTGNSQYQIIVAWSERALAGPDDERFEVSMVIQP